jgi:signal transduction histidine kinase/CheY-like chemotaxis protein
MSEKSSDGAFQAEIDSEWEQVGNAFLPLLAGVSFLGAAVIVAVFWGVASTPTLLSWLSIFLVFSCVRYALHAVAIKRRERGGPIGSFYRVWYWLSLSSAFVWGLAIWLFFDQGGAPEQLLLCMTVYCFCILNSQAAPSHHPYFYSYLTLCLAPLMLRIALPGGARDIVMAFVVGAMLAAVAFVFHRFMVSFKARGEALLWQLNAEKATSETARRWADAARHEAEVATRAKTQFLAAASHDLRQPLHAVGLFAEALRLRTHDREGAQLVTSINGAVDALEELFSELLDITKVDSGSVTANPEHFAAERIFRRMRLHFEPVAFEKGLALRFRGGHHVLHADPVLVERIVRNLVSNALRYTYDGTVLVSCRRRAGRLLLQVWDTGVGIQASERERIFEEFYRVPGVDAMVDHQRRGLGLGLSIAQRFATLMNAPLTLHSEPARGSVFGLELSPGDAREAHHLQEFPSAPTMRALDGRSIVVVDDEPAVRAGVQALLISWGAQVIAFDSAQAFGAWAERSDSGADRPDLLIVDYRLESDRTGFEVIEALRQRFDHRLAVIMVTGSVMSGLETQARDRHFQLLLKPVAPHKLRSLVNFALSQR